jgi:hypothetical protein
MTNRFIIGNDHAGWDQERYDWIKKTFDRSDYLVYGDGFIYNDYYVEFLKPEHATLYRLRWP